MNQQRTPSPHSGFGLIEMAIIMVIVGVLIATIMPRILGGIATDKAKQAKFSLEEVRDEIIGYATINNKLPTPATDATSGDSIVPSNIVTHPFDAWGNTIRYIVAKDSGTGNSLDNMKISSANGTQVDVVDRPYDTGTITNTTNDVAFIVYSLGADMTLDNSNGVANGIGTFTEYPFEADTDGPGGGANTNDDLVEYVILDYLQTKAQGAADTPVTPAATGTPTAAISFDTGGAGYTPGNAANVSTVTMADGTGVGDVLQVDSTDGGYIELTDPLLYRRHAFTIMGWFRTVDDSVDNYEPIMNRENGGSGNRTFWLVTWANNTSQGHVQGEYVVKASTASSGDFAVDTNAQTRLALITGRHHDAQWHFFAASMNCTTCDPLADYSTVEYETQTNFPHTLTIYISDNATADDLESASQSLAQGPELGPDDASAWPTYIGREVYIGGAYAGRSFDGFMDEIYFYDYALGGSDIEAYYDSAKYNYQ